jgi:hypothetical protein
MNGRIPLRLLPAPAPPNGVVDVDDTLSFDRTIKREDCLANTVENMMVLLLLLLLLMIVGWANVVEGRKQFKNIGKVDDCVEILIKSRENV